MTPPSDAQLTYIRGLQKKLRITESMLNGHCQRKYDGPFDALDIRQASALIVEMVQWKAAPAELLREQGQMDLFEVAP
jgi:hypothetical protein